MLMFYARSTESVLSPLQWPRGRAPQHPLCPRSFCPALVGISDISQRPDEDANRAGPRTRRRVFCKSEFKTEPARMEILKLVQSLE